MSTEPLDFERNRKRVTSLDTPLRPLLAPVISLLLMGAMVPAAAQLRLDVVPETALPSKQGGKIAGASEFQLPAATARSYSGSPSTSSSWLGSAVQLEQPRATGTGQYTRPKFHVGVPSESMRSFMNSAGLPADKCQLPMVRARTKSNGDGNINGTLWLFARCTFH